MLTPVTIPSTGRPVAAASARSARPPPWPAPRRSVTNPCFSPMRDHARLQLVADLRRQLPARRRAAPASPAFPRRRRRARPPSPRGRSRRPCRARDRRSRTAGRRAPRAAFSEAANIAAKSSSGPSGACVPSSPVARRAARGGTPRALLVGAARPAGRAARAGHRAGRRGGAPGTEPAGSRAGAPARLKRRTADSAMQVAMTSLS